MALTYIQNGLTEEFATYLTETGLINADNALRGMANGAGILHWLAQLNPTEFEENGDKMLEIFLTKFRELKEKGEGDIKDIIALIWKPDYEGATSLHWAAQSNNSKVVKLLLRDEMSSLLHSQSDDMVIENHSVAVNYLDDKSETPLFYACLEGHLDCVKLLVEEGADMNLSSKMNGFTPLHTAAINSHKGVVTYLIEKGANQSLRDVRGNTALDLAKELQDEELIDYFDPVQRAKIERILELEKQCKDYEKYIENLETTKKEFEEKMNEFDSILKEKDDAISGLNQTIVSLNSQIKNAKEENNVLYDNNNKILSEKNSVLDEIRGLILEREKDFLEKQSLLQQIATLEQTVENKDTEIRNLNDTKREPVDRRETHLLNNISSDTKMELSDNIKKDLEQGLYRQIRESLNNFNMFNQITVASISDTIRQLDLVLDNKQ